MTLIKPPFKCAVVGATGMVGRLFVRILEERKLPISRLFLFASARSVGKQISFRGSDVNIEELRADIFQRGIDAALFAVDSDISREYAPLAVKSDCIVIDNSSAWRMEATVPLVVPEVNGADIGMHKGIIANPNCCAAPAVVALKPLCYIFGLKRVVISTYQSVSGAGNPGMEDLKNNQSGQPSKFFPHTIDGNLIPHIGDFHEDGYTGEEKKVIEEIRKMLHEPNLGVTVTTVRVPVKVGHSLSMNVTLKNPFELSRVREILSAAPGVILSDEPEKNIYPMPLSAEGKDDVFIGRLRRDESFENSLNMWISCDNTRKGAATNAVQILEKLIGREER